MDYNVYGVASRPGMLISIDFHYGKGGVNRRALPVPYRVDTAYDRNKAEVVVIFTAAVVTIKGKCLEPIYNAIATGCLAYVKPSPLHSEWDSKEGDVLIESIDVKERRRF